MEPPHADVPTAPSTRGGGWDRLWTVAAALLAALHSVAIWLGLDGWKGLTNGWPLWRDDHPLFFYYATITRGLLSRTGTTAGYDPTFMSGYAKSIHFPPSSTLIELIFALTGGSRPELIYKLYVLVSVAAIPWLVWWACRLFGLGRAGGAFSVALFVVYLWTDFPINYAAFGMVPYLLAVPFGLAATGMFLRYCERGGLGRWVVVALMMGLAETIHSTSAMVIAPAAAAIYAAAWWGSRGKDSPAFPRSRHIGVWLIPLVVVALNAYWWLPGFLLRETKGSSGFAFAHPEGVLVRLRNIFISEAAVEPVLVVMGLIGTGWLARRSPTSATGLAAFALAGFGWGYLAGGLRSLDFLQPGRHTLAFYTGMALAAGYLVERVHAVSRERAGLITSIVAGLSLVALGGWYFGPSLGASVQGRVLGPIGFLSSRPSPRLLWVVSRVRRHVSAGERLYYEEGGFGLPDVPDPFQGGRFSGLLPTRVPGIEVIGGPYLHAALTTNFTQFGENRLFENPAWDRDWFLTYARLYRPSAILCWSPKARGFCKANPDLVEIKDDDGTLMIGRVRGFGGAAIEGTADVKATPGQLTVSAISGGVDGFAVLRYHSVPYLRAVPPIPWEEARLEGDPVPFIKLRTQAGPVKFEWNPRPGKAGGPGS